MTQSARHPITLKPVLYQIPGTEKVRLRADVEFHAADGSPRLMDMYRPPEVDDARRLPVVVIVEGYPDDGMLRVVGCRFREMAATVSWARLIAASGMVAVAYSALTPASDVFLILSHLRTEADALGLDGSRVALFASSGHVPVALSALMEPSAAGIVCAALLYGYTLDLDGLTGVADASRTFGFVNPCEGRPADDLSRRIPLLVARAGKDEMPRLNDAQDRFVAAALARNVPMTVINHAEGVHGFDIMDDSAASHDVVKQTLRFLSWHLRRSTD